MRIVTDGPWQQATPTELAKLYRAIMVSPTIHICEALLRGETVPLGRLDTGWVRRLGLR